MSTVQLRVDPASGNFGEKDKVVPWRLMIDLIKLYYPEMDSK
jgi:hypothetical protein